MEGSEVTRYALTHGTPHSGPRRKRLTEEERREQKKTWEILCRLAKIDEKKKSRRQKK
jgi:hypothetical protein